MKSSRKEFNLMVSKASVVGVHSEKGFVHWPRKLMSREGLCKIILVVISYVSSSVPLIEMLCE
jgi:hypothetical protein